MQKLSQLSYMGKSKKKKFKVDKHCGPDVALTKVFNRQLHWNEDWCLVSNTYKFLPSDTYMQLPLSSIRVVNMSEGDIAQYNEYNMQSNNER